MARSKKLHRKQAAGFRLGTFVSSAWSLGVLGGAALIVLAVFFAYFPALNGGFVLDDDKLLTDNKLIKAPDGLGRFWGTTEAQDYWPVSNSSLWIEWRLWGISPTGYHVTNLILHIVESCLLWMILRKLSIPGAFLAALIFAVHPVNVESVAWISSRKNLLAMLFFLLSILCYLKFEIPSFTSQHTRSQPADAGRSPTAHRPLPTVHYLIFYWLSLMMFVLAMLSKGSVAVLPVLLLGIIWWQRTGTVPIFASAKMGLSPYFPWDLIRLSPFFAIGVVLAGVNVWFQKHGTGEVFRSENFIERLLGAGGVIWFYLYKALLPIDLYFVYVQWHIKAGNLLWWLPLMAAVVVTIILWRDRKTWSRALLFAWGFFCVSLTPVLGFTDVGFMRFSLVADRYQHIAVIGVIALAAAGWSVWLKRSRQQIRWAPGAAAVIGLFALTLLSWQQSKLYANVITLYQATLEKNPECWMAHNNLGMALLQTGQPREAMEHFQEALRLKSDYADAHHNLGLVLVGAGRVQEAIEHYQQVLRLKPDFYEAFNNMGVALFQTGQTDEAILHFRQALRLKADYAEAQNNLGVALRKADRLDEALDCFTEAIEINPDYLDAYYNLMTAYAKTGQTDKSLGIGQKALDIARSKGAIMQIKKFEDWLNAYRTRLSNPPGY